MPLSPFSKHANGDEAVYELLLLASRLHLTEADRKEMVTLLSQIRNWNLFAERSAGTHLAPILHKNLQEHSVLIPQKVLSLLSNSYNQVLVRNIRLYESFGVILGKLNQANIDCVPMKGIYLAEKVYKDLGFRHLSDIDMLIRSKDVDRMLELMRKDGWSVRKVESRSKIEKEEFSRAHPYALHLKGVTVELHTHLYNQNQGAAISEQELWELTDKENFCGGAIHQFGPEMLLQHLCLHLHKHLNSHELKVLNLCDIHELIVQYKGAFDWNHFRTVCEKYGCLTEVSETLQVCSKFCRTEIPTSFFRDTTPNKILEEKFLTFLTGESGDLSKKMNTLVSVRMNQMRTANGPIPKLKFIFGFVFPNSTFMYDLYKLKDGTWLFPWYVFRVIILSGKLILAIPSMVRNLFR